jgi:hypothetical protein
MEATLTQHHGRTEQRVFESVTEMIEHALCNDPEARQMLEQLSGGLGWDNHLKRGSFIGRKFGSHDEVKRAANEIWPEGVSILMSCLDEVRDAVLPKPQSRRRRTCFSEVDGSELDYDRLRSGQEFWRTSRRMNTSSPANLTLSVDVATSAGRDAKDIMWRGVAAILLVELLEAAGYRVELWAHSIGDRNYTDGTSVTLFTRLKALSDPLDMSTLVNAVSGWFYRTVWFAEYTRSDIGRYTVAGLGSCVPPTAKELAEVTHDPETLLVHHIWNRQDAVQFVRSTLSRFAN